MSGHSKWHNIRLKKAKVDAAKSGVTSKCLRDVMLAARQGGGNPDGNFKLKIMVERAREANVSLDSITRAIKRGTGEGDGGPMEELTYEAYGPGGAAILVEAATDNRNRTASEIRFIFSKHGGRMAEVGAVSCMFEQKGLFELEKDGLTEDDALTLAIEAGAEDMKAEDEVYEIYTAPDDLDAVRTKIEATKAKIVSADLTMIPKTMVTLDADDVDKMIRLLSAIEEQDDVSNIHTNFDMPEESE
ncbi:MAG: YebC/PmpR family DNA-binding transcriptional regulator [Bacillota bacterium]